MTTGTQALSQLSGLAACVRRRKTARRRVCVEFDSRGSGITLLIHCPGWHFVEWWSERRLYGGEEKRMMGENTQLYVQIRHAGKGVSHRCVCEMVVNTTGLGFLTLI